MPTVLIVDDNPAVHEALSLLLSLRQIRPVVAHGPEEALAVLDREPVDVVIQDMNFTADTTNGQDGSALFHALRARAPDLPVILLTAWTRLEDAVKLVKAGAADYLQKPWDDARLLTSLENLLELAETNRRLAEVGREWRERREALVARYDLRGVVFASEPMLRTLELACRVARSALPVLVTGPNGAGKEHVAAIVHANSDVRDGPFVAVNCGALPADLLEAELFGAESGAFTGAGRAREGRFSAADGGTLFLDEIGNLSLAGQMKLLRVLQTGRFERLGSNVTRQVRVRVLSATNADLSAMVRDGLFREDLLYRLNAIEIDVPALARRRDDVLPLAEHFLGTQARLSEAARDALLAHNWPGNVRELRNAIDRAVLLCGDARVITPEVLHLGPRGGLAREDAQAVSRLPTGSRNLDEPTREQVVEALARAGGVVSRTASILGISRQALYRRMERYGLAPTP